MSRFTVLGIMACRRGSMILSRSLVLTWLLSCAGQWPSWKPGGYSKEAKETIPSHQARASGH